MGVDERRDHSFRIPRPDLTQSLGVPNACNTCHQDRDAGWANSEIISWFGERPPHYGTAFAAGQRGDADAEAELAAIASDSNQPIMVRASALALLGNYNRGYTLDAIRAASNGSPLLQLGATDGAASLSAESQWRLLSPLLSDEHLAVRNAAFSALLPLAADPAYADRLQAYFPAYIDSLQASRDFPGTLVNLANAYFAMGDRHQAEALLDEALTVQPSFVPALLNQADLYRATLRDAEAEELLQQALTVAPESAQVAYSHALWLTRQQQPTAALKEFRRAATLAPDELQYGYALAIALNDSGQGAQAVRRLETLLSRWPDNTTLLSALVTMLRDQQRYEEALNYMKPLLQQNPNDQSLRQLETVLRSLSG
jgi:tetratricopeptide (TPR) repeat protein